MQHQYYTSFGTSKKNTSTQPFFNGTQTRCLIESVKGELSGSADVKRAVHRMRILGRLQPYCALPTVQHPKLGTQFKQRKNRWLLNLWLSLFLQFTLQFLCATITLHHHCSETDTAQGPLVTCQHFGSSGPVGGKRPGLEQTCTWLRLVSNMFRMVLPSGCSAVPLVERWS